MGSCFAISLPFSSLLFCFLAGEGDRLALLLLRVLLPLLVPEEPDEEPEDEEREDLLVLAVLRLRSLDLLRLRKGEMLL